MLCRSTFTIVILLLAYVTTCGQDFADTSMPKAITLKDMHLKGHVESITEKAFSIATSGDTVLESETYYAFNEQSQLLKKETTIFATGRKRVKPQISYYGYEGGRLVSVSEYEGSDLNDSTAIIYNRKKLPEQKWLFDKDGKISNRVRYTYNSKGQLTIIRFKNKGNELLGMQKLYYGDNRQKTDKYLYKRNMQFVSAESIIREPDSSGNMSVMRFLYGKKDTCTGMISYVADADGNHLQETTSDENKRVTDYRTIEYDSLKNMRKAIIFKEEKLVVNYKYVYDKFENWTEQTTYNDDEPFSYTRRRFTYFNNVPDIKTE